MSNDAGVIAICHCKHTPCGEEHLRKFLWLSGVPVVETAELSLFALKQLTISDYLYELGSVVR